MEKCLFVLSFCMLIAACSDGGVGVNSGSSSSNVSESGEVLGKSKSITVANESNKTIKLPAISLIAEAFSERVPNAVGDNSRMDDASNSNPANSEIVRNAVKMLWFLKSSSHQEFEKQFKNELLPVVYNRMDATKSEEELAAMLIRFRMERRVVSCTAPFIGWEYSPYNKDSYLYMESIANACDFANIIHTEIAGKIGNAALNDPDAAAVAVLESWDSIPLNVIESTWASVVQKNKGGEFAADGTGVKGVKFSGPGGVYWNQGGGFVVTKNASNWFGEGAISGKVIDFNLRSSLSTKMEKSKSQSSSQGTQSGSKSGADVGIK